jgi:mono/diheme cytochrome c family protein
MRRQGKMLCALALLMACVATNTWSEPAKGQAGDGQGDALIKRGAYLVNEVGQCGECHTPRNDKGVLDATKHLQGGPLWFTSKIKFKKWENNVPDITASGKAGAWTEERMVKFFTTGEKVDMPMPAYHMTVDDAKAVTAYLRSLPGKKK